MIKWIVKRFLVSKVNDLLYANIDNVVHLQNNIDTWIGRLQKILECLKLILAKFDDGKLEAQEIDDSVLAIEKTIKNW